MIFLGVLNLIALIVVLAGVLGMRDAQRMTDRQLRALLARVPRCEPTEMEIMREMKGEESFIPDHQIGVTTSAEMAAAINELVRRRVRAQLIRKQEV